MTTLLFQGDSITDADRDRTDHSPNHPNAMGSGYAFLAMCRALKEHPSAELRASNRGVSGDRVCDLEARWEEDCIALEPTVLSILIGINDLWRKMGGEAPSEPADYERQYDRLLTRTRAALPGVKLMVGEPFALLCGDVTSAWFPELDERRSVAKHLAGKHGALFVPFHERLSAAVKRGQNPAYWAHDGVHPTPQGHQVMADVWYEAFRTLL